jgi:hypothetical protein
MGLFRKKSKRVDTSIEVHNQTIDATGMGDLREEILGSLEQHGIRPGTPQVIDASSVPGLSEEIMGALSHAGVLQEAFGALELAGRPEHDDPVSQLTRLAELHKQGGLSDYEFAVAKQKLLEQRWEE